MTTPNEQPKPAQPNIEPRHIGFFERRWNMVKAFAKKSVEHLFSVKTWVTSAVLFGGMALLSTDLGGQWGNAVAGIFQVTKDNWPMALAKAVAIGTAMNAGIAMYQEAKRCDDCDHLANQLQREQQRGLGQGLAQAQEVMQPQEQPDIQAPQFHGLQGRGNLAKPQGNFRES